MTLDDPNLASCALSAAGAAIAILAAWLWYPKGREPRLRDAAGAFAVAFVAVIPTALLLGMFAEPLKTLPPVHFALATAFVGAAIPEEALKATLVWALLLHKRTVRMAQDGAFFGVVVGAGFALIETLGYIAMAGAAGDVPERVAFVRTLLAGPLHASAAAIACDALVRARLLPGWPGRWLGVRGFVLAVLVHGTYDAGLFLADALEQPLFTAATLLAFISSVGLAFWGMERARRADDRRLAALKLRGTRPLGPLPGTRKLG